MRSLAILAARERMTQTQFMRRVESLLSGQGQFDLIRKELLQVAREQFKTYDERLLSKDELASVNEILKTGYNQFALTRRGIISDYVDIVTTGIKSDTPQIEMVAEITRKTETAQHHARSIVVTGVSAIGRVNSFSQARRANIDKFRYSRNGAERPFCREMVRLSISGVTYTKEQILRLDNGQGLPVIYYCGGYRCQHKFITVWE